MKLHVFSASPNARKAMMAAELAGVAVDTVTVDLPNGAHQSAEYLALNPNGKVPVLEFDDGATLWESNAIINRLAAETKSDIWPATMARYDIMRWQFWESCHWTPACSKYIGKYIFGNDFIDLDAAAVDFNRYAKVLDDHLSGRDWLVSEAMSTADISVAAILCYRDACHYPIAGYANIARWIGRIEVLDAWKNANPKLAA